jgi:release factor glutamine methyltransferase
MTFQRIDTALDTALARAIPLSEARALLALVTGLTRTALIARNDTVLTPEHSARFAQLLERRASGEPLAYLTGLREFYGRDFIVSPDVLIPRPETELLVEFSVAHAAPSAAMLDLGCGSGAIAVSIAAARADLRVCACDISDAALAVARANNQRLASGRVDLRLGSWFVPFATHAFDMIASNPPYVAHRDPHLAQGDVRFEPALALSDHDFDASSTDGLACIRHIIRHAPSHLVAGGWLALEHGYDQAPAVRALLAQSGFVDIESQCDLAGIERISVGRTPGT